MERNLEGANKKVSKDSMIMNTRMDELRRELENKLVDGLQRGPLLTLGVTLNAWMVSLRVMMI